MMCNQRKYTFFDNLCLNIDQVVRALTNNSKTTGQAYPAEGIDENLAETMSNEAAALMRINHAGEICAQALYHGQAIVSKTPHITLKLQQAAIEEGDHLTWCARRLKELDSHTSYLNPLWYTGSFLIGVLAGMAGDKWSLGFVAETERQVVAHLKAHMGKLFQADARSYKIIAQMEQDEARHRDEAIFAGAEELPGMIKKGMQMTSKIMVKTAYWV